MRKQQLLTIGLGVALIHVVCNLVTPYEFHRDEFLYMAMGRHLSLFGMDFPPFIAMLSELERGIFGDSLAGLRLAPALAHGALVAVTGLIVMRLRGDAFAQGVAMLAVMLAPLYMRAGNLFQPVVFDQLWWTCAALALLHITRDPSSARGWVALGLALGIGLLTKFSVLAFGFAIFCAIVFVKPRWLRTRWPWLAALIALLVGSPSFIGQITLGLPFFAQMHDLREVQLERIGYGEFLTESVLMFGPVAFALAVTGAVSLMRARRLPDGRLVGVACVVTFLIIMALRGKPYYAGPVYPMLIAAGAVRASEVVKRAAPRVLLLAGVMAWGLFVLPIALPMLSPRRTAAFAERLGVTAAVRTNSGVVLQLPQDFADMLGWETKVARIAEVYQQLSPAEQRATVVVASNYGQAGAIDFYGPKLGLPDAVAHIGSYWFWGPGDKPGDVILHVGDDREDLTPHCGQLELATTITEPWVVPEERDLSIWICRQPVETLQQIWPRFRGRN